MRNFVLCIAVSLLLAAVQAGAGEVPIPTGRLSHAVEPRAYRLDLTILPDQADFAGVTEIDVGVAAPTQVIYLHGNELAVTLATLTTQGGVSQAARYEQVDPSGVAKLTFDGPVAAGAATLRIAYTARFRPRGEGLYRTTIAGEAYAFTQFEPIDARRMFPGFDEPGFKTPFEVTVTTSTANSVIGNAPVRREEPAGDGRKRVVFETTRPLPTYLLALAVGPLDIVDGEPLPPNKVRQRPLPVRGAAVRGNGPKLHYALESTNAMVSDMEVYFEREYPYDKLDLIASPESDGGMENAGAIIYGESGFLIGDHATLEQRRRFGSLHAHELAHQWFGDLVTPKWWDDTWLNEAFADWMSFKVADAWRPGYHFRIVPLQQSLAAMALDSRVAARQIRQPVTENLAIASSFDAITYLKGAGVLSMFENYLGEDAFRAGIRTHMRRFAYSVADVEDFMSSLAQGSGRKDVVPAFRSFIDQPGVPLVGVRLDCGGRRPVLHLTQSRYLPVGSRGNPQQRWQVPLCLRRDGNAASSRQCVLLKETSTTVPLTSASCPGFVMPNADGSGYYRFSLNDEGWRALMTNFGRLNEREALAAADSLSASFQANRLSTEALMAAIRTIAQSPYPAVALAPGRDLVRLRDYLAPAEAREAVLALMRATYGPRLEAIGAASPSGGAEPEDAAAVDQALYRNNLVKFLALEGRDAGLRSTLAEQARRYVRMGDAGAGLDETAVEPARVDLALQVGVQELGAPFVEALIDRLVSSNDSRFRTQAVTALGSTDDPVVGKRVRQLLLDPRLRAREPSTLAFALAARPSQRRATFDWFKENQQAFIGRVAHFGHRFLPGLGAGFCSIQDRDDVQATFTAILGTLQGAERTLAETLEGIELCAALTDAKRAEVGRYFATATISAEFPKPKHRHL